MEINFQFLSALPWSVIGWFPCIVKEVSAVFEIIRFTLARKKDILMELTNSKEGW